MHMASIVRGQDESNAALWLATWARNMELRKHSGLPAMWREKNAPKSHNNKCFGQVDWI